MKCWIDDKTECNIEADQIRICPSCPIFQKAFANKVIYCNNDKCLHYRALPYKEFIKYHQGYSPLGEDDCFTGVCARRDGIGIKPKNFETASCKYKFADCMTKSDVKISGHMDFSKFPQGGRI